MDMETSSDPTYLLPDYSKLSDSQFTQKLLKSTSTVMNQDDLSFILNQKEIFVMIRQLTQLFNKFNYSKLQYEQWSYYLSLGLTEGIWNGRVSKKMAVANSMCYTYGRSTTLIKQQLKKYKQQFEKNQEAIYEHMKQVPSIINMEIINNIINDLVSEDQHQLHAELERRKIMLRLEAEEHRLIENFYGLKPKQTEISSAKVIWKAIHEQQNIINEMTLFKKWHELHDQESSYTPQGVQLPTINHIFTVLSFQRQTFTAEEIAQQTFKKVEEFAKHYSVIANMEQTKLQSTKLNHRNSALLEQIIHVINERENNLITRLAYELEEKINRLLSHTPIKQTHAQHNTETHLIM
ncbi:unnamed protein product [Rotaria sp. Silwood2]|nr:unnamed protein product [Rotaria sp. Silwood2]CAF2890218.1 unnamed protein product [Rotaria sp. Silwood2]CAF3104379.1 unnamed protein product [Rotaria sp. Silwood2]CAF3277368.1 unnamed protein product [Rotaria sp. Silwood2]CAF4416720.1 unnamed protein product [Rotaria sp. Silwood2]